MAGYKHLLLVVDLSDDSQIIGQRAVELARTYGAKLDVLQVVEFVLRNPCAARRCSTTRRST